MIERLATLLWWGGGLSAALAAICLASFLWEQRYSYYTAWANGFWVTVFVAALALSGAWVLSA